MADERVRRHYGTEPLWDLEKILDHAARQLPHSRESLQSA